MVFFMGCNGKEYTHLDLFLQKKMSTPKVFTSAVTVIVCDAVDWFWTSVLTLAMPEGRADRGRGYERSAPPDLIKRKSQLREIAKETLKIK
jgi:hypothetical protein